MICQAYANDSAAANPEPVKPVAPVALWRTGVEKVVFRLSRAFGYKYGGQSSQTVPVLYVRSRYARDFMQAPQGSSRSHLTFQIRRYSQLFAGLRLLLAED